jgi:diphosphomevalonate decarboxylase
MKVEASAPSNIALIKYMGKLPADSALGSRSSNLPTNASLSYSVEHLRSFVVIDSQDRVHTQDGAQDSWSQLDGFVPIELSPTGLDKFLGHFKRLKTHFGIEGAFHLRSANNFPSDCGMASSASSFAALTLATAQLASKLNGTPLPEREELSRLSRAGSGSSCRSMFSPWSLWRSEGAQRADLNLQLEHAAIVIEAGKKPVTTSQAHLRVSSSSLFGGRAERAERRLEALVKSFETENWRESYEICWAEFWDMHALFETSHPHFGYMTAESLRVLSHLRNIWEASGDGPLVTMDAGANVHVFFRPDQTALGDQWLRGLKTIKSWDDGAGLGRA